MFIDIHVHPAFYEPINEDPVKEELRHETLDIHKNGTAPLEHIFNQMACAGLDYLTLVPEDYNTQQNGEILVTNEEIKKLVDMAPDKFIGFASVDPCDPTAPERLEKAFTDLKLKGLKLHPAHQHVYPTDERCEVLYQICEKYNKPVIMQSGLSWEPNSITEYSHPLKVEAVAAKHPKLRISLTQFGWPWCREVAMLLLKYPNLYTDTGALYFDCAREFYEQMLTRDVPLTWIDRSLRHQVMFGSNNPRFEQIRMAEAIQNLGFRDETVELIKGRNAIEFLGGLD